MYLDFFVILNDTDRAREIERAIKYGEIKYGERESNQILRSNMERDRDRDQEESDTFGRFMHGL